ncbi:MAG: hypothetical protein V7676_10830 [Parasphingorhabdus sp.]|uniref:hypothetical protein n=1 Tax=Parasphingorhabdus sp. TaxID=2709688 RepID=UPI0030032259
MKLYMSLAPIIGLSLSACGMQARDFPSLSKRPYEDGSPIEEPVAPPSAEMDTLPATLKNAVESAVRQSETAHQIFMKNLPNVKQSVSAASGAVPSSESWVVAQMLLSSLETDRSPSVSALADIDSLYMKRLDQEFTGEEQGAAKLIARSRERIEARVTSQQQEIDGLKSRLR